MKKILWTILMLVSFATMTMADGSDPMPLCRKVNNQWQCTQ